MAHSTYSPVISLTPTISATPDYEAGDVVGGILTFPSVFGLNRTGILKHCTVKDNANQKKAFTILLFHSLPTGTYTDNAAFSWGTGDFAKCIGKINIAEADFETVGSKGVASVEFARNVYNGSDGSSLYAIIVTTGAPNYGAADDITIQLGVLPD